MKTNLRLISVLLAGLLVASCSVLSKRQMELVENLAFKADTITSSPSVIFKALGEIRLERGLYYAASLSDPQARFKELNSLAEAAIEDKKRAEKSDIYVQILSSYVRALKSAANEERWRAVGREFRGLGSGVDSVIVQYNELFDDRVPEGLAKSTGKVLGFVAEGIDKYRQGEFLKRFVAIGDTLVGECVDSLTSILKSEELNELIENEAEGLEANYRAYVIATSQMGFSPQISHDREYVELVEKMASVKQLRNKSVSALRSLKNGHRKLALELAKEGDGEGKGEEVFEDFRTLNRLALDITKLVNEL